MKVKHFFILSAVLLFGCGETPEVEARRDMGGMRNDVIPSMERVKDSLHIKSNYDLSTVDEKNKLEFMESLADIEKNYGEQWDFCTCVIKNDSINKAFSQPVSDAEFDRLVERSDAIGVKCQAFLVQSPNQTPDERAMHQKKVRDCLKEAGVK